jgi:Mrp family chromosome partitioning ATPase/capsular polysaccharide biosynthesis protein
LRPTGGSSEEVSLRDYLQVARRRKWIIVAAVVITALAAFGVSSREAAKYQASARVLLSSQNLSAELTGTQAPSPADTNELQTQAALARVPAVASRAIATLHLAMSPAEFLAETSASASGTSNLLTFTATRSDPLLAERMATAYAQAYVKYRFASETAPIAAAQTGLRTRIKETPAGPLRNSLVEKEQTLAELAALKTSDASVVQTADSAAQVAPHTKRTTVLGVVLGLLLGVGLALLREALDTRVRSADAVSAALGLPMLARLPEPARKFRDHDRLAMLEEPSGIQAEAFRMLRTNLEFAALGKDVQTVMVTSAVEKEGKSTTVANLAIALARAGQRVVLVDLDLRRPFVERFFGLVNHAGLTQVAVGHVSLDEALTPISLDAAVDGAVLTSIVTGNGQVRISANGAASTRSGTLHVLPSGPIPPDPGEFVGTVRLTEILEQLRDRADIVLIDAPPLFHVGDALVLSAKVDAVVVVTRMEVVRRPMVAELHRLLGTMPATKLGFVVTGAEADVEHGSGYGGYYYYRPYERSPEEVSAR